MKYPLIVTPDSDSAIKVIVFNEGTDSNNAIHIDGRHKGKVVKYSTDGRVSDITREYLSNTWGIVESKEHAEFIIELAELHGFGVWKSQKIESDESISMFFFDSDDNELQLYHYDISKSVAKFKKITIPLPPNTKTEKPDFSKPPIHFDCVCNKCGGKCCIGNCDEWPKVGSIAQTNLGLATVVLGADRFGYYVVDIDGVYSRCKVEQLQKPKSKHELLIEELQTKLCNNNAVDNYILACDIINGEIEGLSYGDSN